MRVCVYTAIFGDYDNLHEAEPQSVRANFICYTDNVKRSSPRPWSIVRSYENATMHPRLRAKWYKTHPHVLFPANTLSRLSGRSYAYDLAIWVDGSVRIHSRDFVKDLVGFVNDSGVALFPHPDRDCIYQEAIESRRWKKYEGQPLEAQIESYRREGFPPHAGLVACGIIVRRLGAPSVAEIDDAWWEENRRWTIQDQLSFPVVLWRAGLRCGLIEGNLWNNKWFEVIRHPREEGLATGQE